MEKSTTIILVDDHSLLRETWGLLISQNKKYEILLETGDGQKAIDKIRDKKPDIVLLDINMIPLSGFDILKTIKKNSPLTKVIAVSLHSNTAYAKRMFKEGASGYVTKNSPASELFYAIEEVMMGKRYVCNEVKDIISNAITDDKDIHISRILTRREYEVVNHIKDGMTSKQIALHLAISDKTVEVHRSHIMQKLKAKNTAALLGLLNEQALFL